MIHVVGLDDAAFAAPGASCGRARRCRRTARARPLASGYEARLMASIPPLRDDLGVAEGYHSPQLDVEVRLNTNESPLPPPRAFVAALAEEVGSASLHRYPDRSAWELREALASFHGVRPEQVFVANGSNEVLQCLLLAYGGPGRTAAVFEPTYAMHSTIARMTGTTVAIGERDDEFMLDPDEVQRVFAESSPEVTFVCSPNNPTGRVEPKDVVEEILGDAPGLVVVDEAYGQFASWTALPIVNDDHRSRRHPHVLEDVVDGRRHASGYLVGPSELVAALWEKAALPYHVDSLKQAAGRLALRYIAEMEERVGLLVSERERIADRFARAAGRHLAVGGELRPVPAPRHRRARGVERPRRPVGPRP